MLLTSYYEQGYSNTINVVAIDNRLRSNPAGGIVGGINSNLALKRIGFTPRLRYSIHIEDVNFDKVVTLHYKVADLNMLDVGSMLFNLTYIMHYASFV